MKSYLDQILERASRATPGPWSTLEEQNEIHAISLIDKGGDPFHVAEWKMPNS